MSDNSSEPKERRLRILNLLPLLAVAAGAVFFAYQRDLVPDVSVKQTYPDDTLPRPHRIEFGSPITGTEYEIYVQLPHGYFESDKRYPVFYVMPGRGGIAGHRQFVLPLLRQGDIPEAIFVGVDQLPQRGPSFFGISALGNGNTRTRDYTFVKKEGQETVTGGAPDFLAFFRDNIIPFIDATYRTLPGDRGLGGHSLEAHFVMFVAMTEPDLFQRYVVSSPALHATDFTMVDLEEDLAQRRNDLPISLYLSAGQLEEQNFLHGWQVMTDALERSDYTGFRFKSELHPERNHASVVTDAAHSGLIFVYANDS